jgi:predicted dinucleotide-binding enzyme
MDQQTNGIDGEQLQQFVASIMAEHDELDTLKSEHMQACKGPRQRIKEIKADAKEAGLSRPAFSELLKTELAKRRERKRVAALEADDAAALEQMVEAMGDYGSTPLGAATIERARPSSRTAAAPT